MTEYKREELPVRKQDNKDYDRGGYLNNLILFLLLLILLDGDLLG